ncbi:hypothetical protein [Halobellus ordinarius]|uniref:hypothetical protein n=1 Tax=Halobellus ordinarius TaxID=3075120 RepID=UPI0028800590|nr:hypothetical protein [Halobellus sp. ZY16]
MLTQGVIAVVTAQVGDPSVLLGMPGPYYAVGSFLTVLAAAVGLLARRESLVERATDRAIERSPLAILYGVIPFALSAFVGGYVLSQAARVGAGGPLIVTGMASLVGIALVTLAGLGYLVVGSYLTEIEGARRPWPGAVVGAGLSAIPWLVLPLLPALFVWFVLAAVGLGGTTQEWIHGERTVETERSE